MVLALTEHHIVHFDVDCLRSSALQLVMFRSINTQKITSKDARLTDLQVHCQPKVQPPATALLSDPDQAFAASSSDVPRLTSQSCLRSKGE